jgi:hypothetical protein
MRFLVSGILGNLWIRSIVGLMLWSQGRLLHSSGFLFVPYDFLFLHMILWDARLPSDGYRRTAKVQRPRSDITTWVAHGGVWARLLT